jgi:hypothetical protein
MMLEIRMFQVPLSKEVRNRLLGLYVLDHLQKTRNSLMGELAFDQAIGDMIVDISGVTPQGSVLVKISDVAVGAGELSKFFDECVKNRVYEAIVIAPCEDVEDRRTPPMVLFENRVVSGWLRVRNIYKALEFVRDNFKFVVSFERSNVFLTSTKDLMRARKVA